MITETSYDEQPRQEDLPPVAARDPPPARRPRIDRPRASRRRVAHDASRRARCRAFRRRLLDGRERRIDAARGATGRDGDDHRSRRGARTPSPLPAFARRAGGPLAATDARYVGPAAAAIPMNVSLA